jgi:RNA recognition motif-containing protein
MFIGGLNWDTTDGIYDTSSLSVFRSTKLAPVESLRNYFSQFGKVDACTIMRDAAGRSRCFAFLTFEDPASVNAVMVREHFLDGKIVSRLSLPSSLKLTVQGRLTLKEPFRAKNTSELPSCLSGD